MRSGLSLLGLIVAAGCLTEVAQLTPVGNGRGDGAWPADTGVIDAGLGKDGGGPLPVDAGLSDAGPVLEVTCTPLSLDFGLNPVGFPTTLLVTCTFSGAQELPVSALILADGGPSPFSAQVEATTSPGSVLVEVTFTPESLGFSSATLELEFGAPVLATVTIPLAGSGFGEANCGLTLTPTSVAFGSVHVGATETQQLVLTDTGAGDCVIWFDLTPSCAPAFSLPNGPIDAGRLSPWGTDGGYPSQIDIVVSFTPPDAGSFSCQFEDGIPISGSGSL